MTMRRPQLLKDFLASDSQSCSSSGFRSFPRHHGNKTIRNLLQIDLHDANSKRNSPIKLTRSRSKAASATIYAVHRASAIFSNAIKYFPFNSAKSRRGVQEEVSVTTVKVKDILRWRSFRDVVEEESPPPLDFSSPPSRCPTGTTTTTGSTSSPTSTRSWCESRDSDFTAEELTFWSGNSGFYLGKEVGKRFLPEESVGGGHSMVDLKGELSCEEKEQHSPVSVLNFPFQEDEESSSFFHPRLENEESKCPYSPHLTTKLKSTNLEDEFCLAEKHSDCKEFGDEEKDVEEDDQIGKKARQMLNRIRSTCEASVDQQLLFDFFSFELATSSNQNDASFECEILRVVEDWLGGKYEDYFVWDMEGKREAFVRDMERGERWRKFEVEEEELAIEMEVRVLDYLMDEILFDLSSTFKIQKEKR